MKNTNFFTLGACYKCNAQFMTRKPILFRALKKNLLVAMSVRDYLRMINNYNVHGAQKQIKSIWICKERYMHMIHVSFNTNATPNVHEEMSNQFISWVMHRSGAQQITLNMANYTIINARLITGTQEETSLNVFIDSETKREDSKLIIHWRNQLLIRMM